MERNVILLTPVFETGGTESYILSLLENFPSNINSIVVSGGGKRESQLSNKGFYHIKMDSLRRKNIITLFKSVLCLVKIIHKEKINIIHCSSVYTSIIAKISSMICIKEKIKIITTLHGGPNKDIEKNAAKILQLCCDNVIALSLNSKGKLINNGVSEKKITVIYNGIKGLNKAKVQDKEKFIIGSCGRLTEQKGFKYLIEAATSLNINDFEIWIAGEGELENELYDMIKDKKLEEKIKLLGYTENIESLMNNFDIFILPSLWEQFPISILEAMSLGKAIIATNVNGVPEELCESGILVNPESAYELKNGIELLYFNEDLRNELEKKSVNRFVENFKIELMVKKVTELYYK